MSLCYALSKFLPASGFKWIDPKEFELNKYTSNGSKGCVLEVDLEYPKDLRTLRSDYPVAPDKIKREIMSEHQPRLLIYRIFLLVILKNLCLTFLTKNVCASLRKLTTLLETRIKTKKIHRVLEFSQSKRLEPYTEFNTHKRIEAEKMETKMEQRCTN